MAHHVFDRHGVEDFDGAGSEGVAQVVEASAAHTGCVLSSTEATADCRPVEDAAIGPAEDENRLFR